MESPQKGKLKLLDKLILLIVISTISYVGFTFLNCNFMFPGSINAENVRGMLKNPPPLECKESERRGYDALFTVFTALLGLKAKMED